MPTATRCACPPSTSPACKGVLNPLIDGSFTFTANAGFTGITTFSYTVSDGFGGFDTGLVTIDVTNAAPVADDETYTMRPGQTLSVPAPGLLGGDTDADGDSLRVASVNITGLQGTLNPLIDGGFTFTPTAGFSGTTTFSYIVSDGLGGLDSGLVTINVVNAAPVADDETYAVHAGQVLTIAAPGILQGDTDADGDALRVSSVNITGLQGVLNSLTDGSFTFTANAGFTGITTFSYTVSDGFGGFDTGLVTIDVTNAAPVADDETYAVQAGQTLSIVAPGILQGDTDADGDPLSVLSVNITGLQGTLAPQVNGSFSFTPNPGFSGVTTFSYVVSDGLGGFDTGLVTIEVVAAAAETVRIGDAPVRQTGTAGQWASAWSNSQIHAVHKADYSSNANSWSPVQFHGVGAGTLAGGDIYQGDLGVSGRSLNTSAVVTELDGREALRFDLDRAATEVTADLARLFVNDDGGLFLESGLLRLIGANGQVVGETAFQASSSAGSQRVSLAASQGFVAVELLAGHYQGTEFVYGAYGRADGSFGAAPSTDSTGAMHGSDFMLNWIEFDFPLVGVPGSTGLVTPQVSGVVAAPWGCPIIEDWARVNQTQAHARGAPGREIHMRFMQGFKQVVGAACLALAAESPQAAVLFQQGPVTGGANGAESDGGTGDPPLSQNYAFLGSGAKLESITWYGYHFTDSKGPDFDKFYVRINNVDVTDLASLRKVSIDKTGDFEVFEYTLDITTDTPNQRLRRSGTCQRI